MKLKIKVKILILILFLVLQINFGINVLLIPNNISVKEYDSFNITLIVNTNEQLGGFEDIIYIPDGLNITKDDIILSDTANSANLKDVSIENGKIDISLVWFNNYPSGNFTIATLKFKTLNNGTYKIIQSPTLSDTNGNEIKNVSYNSVVVNIIGLNSTIVDIIPINPTINNSFDVLVSIKNAKENIYNISGSIYYPNLKIVNLDFYYFEDNITNVNLWYNNDSLSFFVKLNTSKDIFNLMKLTFFTSKEGSYIINATIKINGKNVIVNPACFTLGNITVEKYVGFPINEKNISYGDSGFIYIKAENIDSNISEIRGNISYNSTLLNVSDISTSLQTLEKNLSIKNNTINFYIKINGSVSNNFNILSFWIRPLINRNITTELKILNISLLDINGSNVNVPVKDSLIIHIIPKNLTENISNINNTPPKVYFVFEVIDDYTVKFYSLCYDKENNTLYYYWNFGDNTTSTDINPTHTYKKDGLYIVKLYVNDSFGAIGYDECLINIKKLNPINITLSNTTIYPTNHNITIYCNITLKNPFSKRIYGDIQFLDYANYKPNKTCITFELLPNETKVFSVPINISGPTEIKGYVEYYIPNKRVIKYVWNFKKDINVLKINKISYRDYYYNISLNQSKVIIKINKILKNYTITKNIDIENNNLSILMYLIGFLIGFLIIYKKKKF